MSGLLDFFTKEAGQKRRAWLDEKDAELTGLLSYFAGPHASDAAGKAGGLLATMSDAADFQDYTDASRATMRDPNLGNLAALATAGTALMVPGVSARMAEGAVDFGQDLARFGREEDGAIRAFHGSPHDFDKFSMDKIGTGEGAQAYGHGLYFAEKEGVAQSYRDALQTVDTAPLKAFGLTDGQMREAAIRIADTHPDAIENGARDFAHWFGMADTPELRAAFKAAKKPGHMYEVNINADPADFLDWDTPFQSADDVERFAARFDSSDPVLRKRIEDYGFLRQQMGQQMPDGNDIIREVMGGIGNADSRSASNVMREAGIPGIKYRDAMSRDGAGDGTRNYVVFDDNLIDIVRKYGWAGLGLLGAFAPQQESDTLQ